MENETEKDFQQQQKPTGTVDPSKKNPSHEGGQTSTQQDPNRKNPGYSDDSRKRDGEESSEQGEKRRAS